MLIMFSVCGVIGVVGAATGPTDTPQQSEHALSESLKGSVALDLNERLREQTIAVARMRGTPLSFDGDRSTMTMADTTLEVGITQIRLSRIRAEAPIALSLIGAARVVRTGDTGNGASKTYFYSAGRHSLDEWMADGGKRLRESLQRAVSTLGEHIHDYALFYYPLPDRSPQLSGFLAATFGLAPLDPKPRGTTIADDAISRRFSWPEVESLQPTLRWEMFPRPGDIQVDAQNMGRISNVRYDLVIAGEDGLSVDRTVYRRDELPAPEHHVEMPLESDRRYFWSVRARFELDGQTRFTEWGNMSFPVRETTTAPSDFSYRFRTP